ncbi:two component, sigma54 specific, transcriptional regulator, Fis family [Labilithrix luteola]|uniref:Two component, sigma54 specific, transcriptional regulator, Fis family n=1 Tax=Labilithrix luteola TaxID=1391654 RepID=A0A0K1Q2P5_9BACT|nr:two component, sigma54 specific, transcriptional regulator, Fis family [Labilithrix luteola]
MVRGPLGKGGLATAFRVRDLALDTDVALKLVGTDPVALDVLRREFLALRAGHHAHLVRVFDFGWLREGGAARGFYTSALVEGVDLAAYARGRSWQELVDPIADVVSALGALHARGVLHGDVHPGNALVDAHGRAVLIDLSCSRPLDVVSVRDVSGTPGFVAPELLRGMLHRTADFFALGVTLRALGDALPARIRKVVTRMTAEQPQDRPQSAEELAELLGVPWIKPLASDLLGTMLVGRDDALRSARSLLDAVSQGKPRPRVLAWVGDDGSGRTRILEEIKAEAQLRIDAIAVSAVRPRAMSTMLGMALGEELASATPAKVASAVDRLSARNEPLVLILDDADALDTQEGEALSALVRSLPEDGKLGLFVTSRTRLAAVPESATLPLRPLEELEIAEWLRSRIPAASLGAIARETAGYPKEIAAVLAQLDAGEWDSRALSRAVRASGTQRGALDLGTLDDEARVIVALVVAAGTRVLPPSHALDGLVRRGLVVAEPDGVRLHRRSDAVRLAEALGRADMHAAHRLLASEAEAQLVANPDRDDLRATSIVHLAAFEPKRASRVLIDAARRTPAFRHAVDAVLEATPRPSGELVHCAAEIYAESGEPARALALIVARLRKRPHEDERVRLRTIAGQCHAQMGDSRRAASILGRVLPHVIGAERARVAAALSLALLKRGDDVTAAAVARSGLHEEPPPEIRLDLLLNAAFATSRMGTSADARHLLGQAREVPTLAPRGRFRVASATAFLEYVAGETPAAVRAYAEALDVAEREGLDDLVASAALNYGSACHELGDLGRALDAYRRGHRLAVALGMPTTRVTLDFDLAKVHADIGAWDAAARHAVVAREGAKREDMALLAAGAEAVLADVATASGDHAASVRHLDEAGRLLAGASDRELVAIALQRARACVLASELPAAARAVESSAAKVRALAMADVEASWLVVRGLVAIAAGRAKDAVPDLERASERAAATGQSGLIADVEARLADAYAAVGSSFLAARHLARARELWEKVAASLPPELHEAFRRHPSRANAFAPEPTRAPAEASSSIDVRRILEINRRLNSASSTNAVLEETLDAAVGLTNAERGFLLVDTPRASGEARGALKVAIARNIDRETIRQGNLKFSRTVAERVVRTGEPVIAVDAGFDPRFTKARSVHAMGLKSLLCVPIRSPDGILGAIYVDHRFSSGSFRSELVDVLLALGDQAALALVKSRLVEELRIKTRELEERNAEVEHLARGQALEIARLKRTIEDDERRTPPAAKRRFDYGTMVTSSLPMQRVLGVLERVIDTDITVLVRGESGTGKERVARVIHANSARANAAFVAINCGALPESLLEAELFGYKRGAFSGATRDQPGLFVAARGGTLFLDELGEMPPSMQVKLLRVLQEREVRPLGATESVPVDVRLVCATNRVLAEEVRAGRFREDLYYRVAVVDIELPPLRDRIEDVLPLAESTLARLATELGRPRAALDRSAERALLAHAWPGNVRELENVLTKAVLLAKRTELGESDLALGEVSSPSPRGPSAALRARIVATLEETDWNVVVASKILGVPRATLYRKMRRFGILRPDR